MDSACSFDLNIIPVDVEKSKHFVDATKYYFVRSQTAFYCLLYTETNPT